MLLAVIVLLAPAAPATADVAGLPPSTAPSAAPSATPSAATSAAPAPATAQPAPKVQPRVFSGRQTVLGKRSLPVLGELDTRTDIWLLARIAHDDKGYRIEQSTCAIKVADVMGVSVDFPQRGAQKLPPVRYTIERDADGFFFTPPWASGWDASDYDGDGWPGITLDVDAGVCAGRLAVTSGAESRGHIRVATEEALELDIDVTINQKVLESDGWCLTFADKQTDDRFSGRVRYEPLPDSATCADVVRLPPALP